MAEFRQRMYRWVWNGLQAVINGLVNAVAMALGIDTVNTFSPGLIQHVTLHQFFVACVVGGGIGLVNYLRSPDGHLPSLDDTVPPASPSVIQG